MKTIKFYELSFFARDVDKIHLDGFMYFSTKRDAEKYGAKLMKEDPNGELKIEPFQFEVSKSMILALLNKSS